MRRYSLHGLTIGVESGVGFEAIDLLFGGLPSAPEGSPIRLIVLLGEARASAPGGSATPLFFHGRLQAFADDGGVVLCDGGAWYRVSAEGGRIDASLDARALGDPHFTANVPLLICLALALRQHGLFHLHAAGLVSPGGRALLVAGGGGSGKTTLTLGLVSGRGYRFLGDDTVLVEDRRPPRVLGFSRPFHLAPATAAAFPGLAPALRHDPARPKADLDAAGLFPAQRLEAADAPSLLLFPEIADRPRTVVERLFAADALGRLIESSALLAVDGVPRGAEHLALLGAIAEGAVGWRVRLGGDFLEDPAAATRALEAAIEVG